MNSFFVLLRCCEELTSDASEREETKGGTTAHSIWDWMLFSWVCEETKDKNNHPFRDLGLDKRVVGSPPNQATRLADMAGHAGGSPVQGHGARRPLLRARVPSAKRTRKDARF